MRKSHFNDEVLVLLGPIISRLFTCSNAEKKGACSSPISMHLPKAPILNVSHRVDVIPKASLKIINSYLTGLIGYFFYFKKRRKLLFYWERLTI
jgi:hypothetical protein